MRRCSNYPNPSLNWLTPEARQFERKYFDRFRKAKEVEEAKKKLNGLDGDNTMTTLKKSLEELERERIEAEQKWEDIQKQEKVISGSLADLLRKITRLKLSDADWLKILNSQFEHSDWLKNIDHSIWCKNNFQLLVIQNLGNCLDSLLKSQSC